MDDNTKYAKDNILNKVKEAREQTEELYEDELRWKIDKILSDTEDKINKAFDNHFRHWQPPHKEYGLIECIN